MARAELDGTSAKVNAGQAVKGTLGLLTSGELNEAVARVPSTKGINRNVNLLVLGEAGILEEGLDISGLDGVQKVAHVDATTLGKGVRVLHGRVVLGESIHNCGCVLCNG